jgi:proteic killer suppression protein
LRLILALLNDAKQLSDLNAPALRLHSLKGNLSGFWAMTVQANWRVIFQFEDGNVYVVDYIDYH